MQRIVSTGVILDDIKDEQGNVLARRRFVSKVTCDRDKIYRKSHFLIRPLKGREIKHGARAEAYDNGGKVTKICLLTGDVIN